MCVYVYTSHYYASAKSVINYVGGRVARRGVLALGGARELRRRSAKMAQFRLLEAQASAQAPRRERRASERAPWPVAPARDYFFIYDI
jgi:hypothetical protein